MPFLQNKTRFWDPQDHFLTCNASERNKVSGITKLTAYLTLLDTLNTITAIIIRGIKSFYYNIIQPPLNQLSPTFLNILQHKETIEWNHFKRGRVSIYITDCMKLFYNNTNSKRIPTSWINSIIKFNLEVNLTKWIHYCNIIQEVNINTSKYESQLHHYFFHEVGTLQRHARGIPNEPSKWFAKDITKFVELNTNSLAIKHKFVSKMDCHTKERYTICSSKNATRQAAETY